jgi:hypothetical protein
MEAVQIGHISRTMKGVNLPLAFQRLLEGSRQARRYQNAAAWLVPNTRDVLVCSDLGLFNWKAADCILSSSDSFPKRDKRWSRISCDCDIAHSPVGRRERIAVSQEPEARSRLVLKHS